MKDIEIPVYNLKGEETRKLRLKPEIFGKKMNSQLLYEVVISQQSNCRQVSASTKGRGEVSGGGKKPWRQKGLGRARHGSIRSPIWRGGGVSFGPTTQRNFKKKINKKKKRLSLFIALSSKVKDAELFLIDTLETKEIKTKIAVNLLQNLPIEWKNRAKRNKSILFGLSEEEKNIISSVKNIPKIETMPIINFNALSLLSSKYLIFSLKGLEVLEKHFLNETEFSIITKGQETTK